MKKNLLFYLIAIVFFILYFCLFKYTLGRIMPFGATGNMISIFIIIIVNIPLSVFSTEKLIKEIKQL